MVVSFRHWYDGVQKGPIRISSFNASNCNNGARPNVPTFETPANDAPGGKHSPDGTAPSRTPFVISSMPDDDCVSTLAQLEAFTVIKRRIPTYSFLISCLCMPSSFGSLRPNILSQDHSVPCILLHYVDGELKDVAKGNIIEPQQQKDHNVGFRRSGVTGLRRLRSSLSTSRCGFPNGFRTMQKLDLGLAEK
jgi:hypothetical protein